jgi:hypothetical protein
MTSLLKTCHPERSEGSAVGWQRDESKSISKDFVKMMEEFKR